jgi:hypothetical protein
MNCSRLECTAPAEGYVGIAFYPMKALMEHYQNHNPITTAIIAMTVCRKHCEEIVPHEFVSDGFENMCRIVELQSGVVVDRNGCKPELVPLDDPRVGMVKKEPDDGSPVS